MRIAKNLYLSSLLLGLVACQSGASPGNANSGVTSLLNQTGLILTDSPLGPKSTGPRTDVGPKSTGPKTRSTSDLLALFQTLNSRTYEDQTDKLTTRILEPQSQPKAQIKELSFTIELLLQNGTQTRIFSASLDNQGVYEYSLKDLKNIQSALKQVKPADIKEMVFLFFEAGQNNQQISVPLLESLPIQAEEKEQEKHLNFDIPEDAIHEFFESEEEERSESLGAPSEGTSTQTSKISTNSEETGDDFEAENAQKNSDHDVLEQESEEETEETHVNHVTVNSAQKTEMEEYEAPEIEAEETSEQKTEEEPKIEENEPEEDEPEEDEENESEFETASYSEHRSESENTKSFDPKINREQRHKETTHTDSPTTESHAED